MSLIASSIVKKEYQYRVLTMSGGLDARMVSWGEGILQVRHMERQAIENLMDAIKNEVEFAYETDPYCPGVRRMTARLVIGQQVRNCPDGCLYISAEWELRQ